MGINFNALMIEFRYDSLNRNDDHTKATCFDIFAVVIILFGFVLFVVMSSSSLSLASANHSYNMVGCYFFSFCDIFSQCRVVRTPSSPVGPLFSVRVMALGHLVSI